MTGSAQPLEFTGAVLAGGESTRMGHDKAFVSVDGETLIGRAARALRAAGACGEVLAVGGDADRARSEGLTPTADIHPGAGPLGGIITAIGAAPCDVVMVLACDHIDPSAVAIASVVGVVRTAHDSRRGGPDAAVPMVGGRAQWMHSAWHRSAHATLEHLFGAGARSPREVAADLHVEWVPSTDIAAYRDADSPDDLRGRRSS